VDLISLKVGEELCKELVTRDTRLSTRMVRLRLNLRRCAFPGGRTSFW
jgi:hypothetical protein